MNTIKILFHTHTNYSSDCTVSIEKFRKICIENGLIPIITDHNTIEGAKLYKKKYGKDSCIIGEEISTLQGEIVGIYVKENIPPGLGIDETIKRLKKQDAIVIIPHPFDRFRKSGPRYDINLLDKKYGIDFIEIFNSRTLLAKDNDAAARFANFANTKLRRKNSKYLGIVGADSHTIYEMNNCYNKVPKFDITKKTEFIKTFSKRNNLATGRQNIEFYTRKSSILVHVITKIVKILKLNKRRGK